LIFPVHPRTARRLAGGGLDTRLKRAGIRLIAPLPYVRFMSLVTAAAAAITDSGGIQEETTYLGIPCLTLRDNTERPVTISEGSNRLSKPETLAFDFHKALTAPRVVRRPELWDGKTAERCVDDLRRRTGPARLPSAELGPAALIADIGHRHRGHDERRGPSSAGRSSYRRSS
jgi:UDP-N-acetylglucosamine 2-epimerase (non-hydrolysing)